METRLYFPIIRYYEWPIERSSSVSINDNIMALTVTATDPIVSFIRILASEYMIEGRNGVCLQNSSIFICILVDVVFYIARFI